MIIAYYEAFKKWQPIGELQSPITIEIDIVLANGVTIYQSLEQVID